MAQDRKMKSSETSQDKLVVTKVFMLQQTIQQMTKIKATRVCGNREVLCRDNNNMRL